MYVVKRVKQHAGETATHYAVSIAPAGNVTEWAKDRARALLVDDATALKVEAFYAAKAAAKQPVGTVTAEDVAPEA